MMPNDTIRHDMGGIHARCQAEKKDTFNCDRFYFDKPFLTPSRTRTRTQNHIIHTFHIVRVVSKADNALPHHLLDPI